MNKKEELFKSKRWNEYQKVKLLNKKVPRTKKDDEDTKEFKEFINKKENTQNK